MEIIKLRIKIHETEKRKKIKEIMKPKRWLFLDKHLKKNCIKRRGKLPISGIKQDIISNTTDIKR